MAERTFDISVNVDTKQADRQLNKFEREIQGTQKELQKLGGDTTNLRKFSKAANDASIDIKDLQDELSEVKGSFGGIGDIANQTNSDIGGLIGTFSSLTTALNTTASASHDLLNVSDDANERMEILQGSASTLRRDLNDLSEAFEDGTVDAAEFTAENARLTTRLNETTDAIRIARTRFVTMRVAILAVGAGAVLAATQIAKMTSNLATLAQTDVGTIQQFGFAASQFGINMDQAANILKDFNDRIGDFVVTGGGPFVDVMERLGKETGLTAEALVSLSGPDALILLKKSMDDANISMQEQTFLLESLGSDLTVLLPLLENNGKAFKEMAASIGLVQASETSISSLTDTANEFSITVESLKGIFLELAGVVAPLVTAALKGINFVLSGLATAFKALHVIILGTAAAMEDWFGSDEAAARLRKEMHQVHDSLIGVSAATKDVTKNVEALRKLQDSRSAKAIGELQKQIDGQVRLASAIGTSVAAYDKEKIAIANLAAQEKLRADLQKQNLRPEQIEAQIQQLIRLQTVQQTVTDAVKIQTKAEADAVAEAERLKQAKIDLFNAEQSRLESVSDFITGLEQELELTKARTEAERDAIRAKHELNALDATDSEAAHIAYLQRLIALQKEANAEVEKSVAINLKSIETEIKRAESVAKFEQSLNNQLELLRAKTEEERKSIAFQQQLAEMDLKGDEAVRLQAIQNQIVAQEKLNDQLEAQREAYKDLGSAVKDWALGSENAIENVILSLLRMAAIQFGGNSNPFVQGFLGGMRGFANGGDFNAGETFMVGERGPEIITARGAGTVVPNHRIGGGEGFSQNISLSINGSIVASEELDRKFEEFAGAVADNTQSLLRNQLRTGGVLA